MLFSNYFEEDLLKILAMFFLAGQGQFLG